MREPLQIDAHLDAIREAVEAAGCAVVVAPPGAGKTTRVPPGLLGAGPLILLQPRRVAARDLTRRIAAEQGWSVGSEIGWQVRHEKRFGAGTRLLVATEGILTARLIDDPLLSRFNTVVLDEFHERSLHADLALALLRQAREARPDLRIVVMSATLDAGPIARFLDNCPIVEVEGRSHPLDIVYAPGVDPANAVRRQLEHSDGHLLVFLPGAADIERTAKRLSGLADVFPLHGSLPPEAQERALARSDRRKVILATNIAETSLTVDGVTAVIDSGLHKTMRLDAGLGFNRLETERISRDSADQRAGRAGRTGPGSALRLWDERDELRSHREPEIHRVDLAAPLLEVLAWGENPSEFRWFDPPTSDRMEAALDLLRRLGALSKNRTTDLGRAMRRLPLHPRLARVVLGARGSREAAAACVALSEGWLPDHGSESTVCDLLPIADRIGAAPHGVRRAADEVERRAQRGAAAVDAVLPERERTSICAAVFAGYPDRLARRRAPGSRKLQLASGAGVEQSAGSGVRNAEYLIAVELRASKRGSNRDALVRVASQVDAAWIEPTHTEIVHEIDSRTGKVRAFERRMYERMEFDRRQVDIDLETAAGLLCAEMLARGAGERLDPALARIAFAGLGFELGPRLLEACRGADGWFEFDPVTALSRDERKRLDRFAPEFLDVPSGRRVRLEYAGPGEVKAAVKLQELFGLAETPRVGRPPVPVTLQLLAPNGRPVQTTRDLRSFWENTYAEVRKQLRGRYPRHPWPENPWSAEPTARTKRRPRK